MEGPKKGPLVALLAPMKGPKPLLAPMEGLKQRKFWFELDGYERQRNITIACFALHNFIHKEGLDDELFSTYDQLNVQLDNENVLVEDDGGVEEDQVVQPQGNASDREL
ncbi:hypothetical protein Tco_0948285 [Tanacetum coccineum]